MSSEYYAEVLKELGWEDGFQIPVSNFENRKLEEEVAKLSLQKFRSKIGYEGSAQKLENIENHVKHINQELDENQMLISAHTQQLHSEEEKFRVEEAEKTKIDYEMRENKRRMKEVGDRQAAKRTLIEKSSAKLDKLKSEASWDEEALQAWEESLKKRDDDNELIKKFSKEDERKYNELEARRQHLEVEYTERKQTIDKMVSDLTNYERILDRTGKAMNQHLTERNALVKQWKESVKILQQRDQNINKLQTRIMDLNDVVEKEREKLNEHTEFYNNQKRTNDEIEFENNQLNSLNSRLRRDLNETTQYLLLLNGQADTLRRDLQSSAKDLERKRNEKKKILNEIAPTEHRINLTKERVVALSEKFDFMQSTASAEERILELKRMMDYEQKQQNILENETKILQNAYFRIQQLFQETINQKKDRQLEMIGVQSNSKHIRKHNEEQSTNLNKQKESLYQLDYKIDEMQSKIFSIENSTYSIDMDELELKFAELEAQMSEHIEVKNLLKDQVNKIQDDMRRLTTSIAADHKQLLVLEDKLLHQKLSFEGGQKQLAQTKNVLQEKQVEESILMLRIGQLNKIMKREKQNMCGYQRIKLNLETATKARLIEIDTHKEVLLATKRNLLDDKSRLKLDIKGREIRLEQMCGKYNIVMMSLGKDDSGQPLSVTYFKVKNAQEKFLLQSEGDTLDQKIKKAEQEIRAMENTLKVVNITNSKFKHSLEGINEGEGEYREMSELEQEICRVNSLLRDKRKEYQSKEQELEDYKPILEELQKLNEDEAEILSNLSDDLVKLEYQNIDKKTKIYKTENRLKTAEKKISQTDLQKYGRNLEIEQMKHANSTVINRLYEYMGLFNEAKQTIEGYIIEYGFAERSQSRRSYSLTDSSSARLSKSSSSSSSTHSVKTPSSTKSSSSSDARNALSKVVIQFDL